MNFLREKNTGFHRSEVENPDEFGFDVVMRLTDLLYGLGPFHVAMAARGHETPADFDRFFRYTPQKGNEIPEVCGFLLIPKMATKDALGLV